MRPPGRVFCLTLVSIVECPIALHLFECRGAGLRAYQLGWVQSRMDVREICSCCRADLRHTPSPYQPGWQTSSVIFPSRYIN